MDELNTAGRGLLNLLAVTFTHLDPKGEATDLDAAADRILAVQREAAAEAYRHGIADASPASAARAIKEAEARVLFDADPVLAEVVGAVEDRIRAVTEALLATADNQDVLPEDQPCWCPEKSGLPEHEYEVCQRARAALTPPASERDDVAEYRGCHETGMKIMTNELNTEVGWTEKDERRVAARRKREQDFYDKGYSDGQREARRRWRTKA